MPSKPFAIGISGGSGSGKTSLTSALVETLGPERCCVLDHDSYYRDLSGQPMQLRQRANFDHPDSLESELMARHVRTLIHGSSIARPVYDFKTHTRATDTERIQPRPVVICEGILLLAVTELRRSFDLRVFVDAPADVRALRRLRRDINERGRTAESVIKQYFETVRPMHEQFVEPARDTADIVLDWRHTAREQALTVMDKMRERLDDEPLTVST